MAQEITQVVRGRIIDKDTRVSLPGANIAVYKDSLLLKGGVTDIDGYYRIENVAVGRYSIIVSFLGYTSHKLSNVNVSSAKELILHVELEESLVQMEEVNIFGTKNIFKYTFVGGQDIIREDYQLGFLPIFYYKIDF